MKTPTRIGLCLALVTLSLVSWGTRPATAEPSGACRGLAGLFADAPAQIDVAPLAALANCVTTELGQRSASAPPPQAAAPSSDESAWQPDPPPQQVWGQWPQSSPWGENWPKSSWDH